MKKAILIICLITSSLWSNPAMPDKITGEVLDTIKKGEIVFFDSSLDGTPGVEAFFQIRATRQNFWNTITDYDHFTDYYDNIEKIQVLKNDAHGAVLELWVKSALKTFHYIVERKYIEANRFIRWDMLSGDFRKNSGSWEIYSTSNPEVCIVRYTSYIGLEGILGKSFQSMTVSETKKRVKGIVSKMRRHVEK